MTAADMQSDEQHYDPQAQDKWQRGGRAGPLPGQRRPRRPGERRYMLDMFPYPSGDLHMGHAEAFAIGDVVARYWVPPRLQRAAPDRLGRLRPARRERRDQAQRPPGRVDLREHRDAGGVLPPLRGLASTGPGGCNTCDPEYYRWTQWLFLRFFERGLAYRKGGCVNWCPHDQTVLANEQVVAGRCERCGAEVTRRELTQWYFKITDYADRLLDDMAQLEGDWPERVLTMQRNWIGRSRGGPTSSS